MKAMGDTVFVRPDSTEQTTASGLVIPDAAKERPTTGVVVSVGERSRARVGARVLFSRYAGQDIEVDGETLVLLKSHDLLAEVD